MVIEAARAVGRTVVPGRDGTTIDLEQPWRRATLLELISAAVDEPVDIDTDTESLRRIAVAHEVALRPSWDTAEILVELYEQLVEQTLVQPTFVCDYPAAVKPLAKQHRTDPGLVEAWDLVINGVELAPAYSEMNDPVIQRSRLEHQAALAAAGDPEANDVDEVFLRALEHGMPPAGGVGMGVDRLVMLLMGVGIRESILFPLLRPEG
jgi:lysyl-tRNA synthetase class 2